MVLTRHAKLPETSKLKMTGNLRPMLFKQDCFTCWLGHSPIERLLGYGAHDSMFRGEAVMARFDPSDFGWSVIQPLLATKVRGVPRADDRRVLNGIFWWLRTGAPWADTPSHYGPHTTCVNRFNRSRRAGIWVRILEAVSAAYDGDIQMIDSSSIRVHPDAANAQEKTDPIAWVARAAALPARSTRSLKPRVCRSLWSLPPNRRMTVAALKTCLRPSTRATSCWLTVPTTQTHCGSRWPPEALGRPLSRCPTANDALPSACLQRLPLSL